MAKSDTVLKLYVILIAFRAGNRLMHSALAGSFQPPENNGILMSTVGPTLCGLVLRIVPQRQVAKLSKH